jgi:hypothetical protein
LYTEGMQYNGPFDLLTLIFAFFIAVQLSVVPVVILIGLAIFDRKRSKSYFKITWIAVLAIFLISWAGIHICNTSSGSCLLQKLPIIQEL